MWENRSCRSSGSRIVVLALYSVRLNQAGAAAIIARLTKEGIMSLHGIVLPAGQGPVIHHTSPGRSFTLKLQNGETAESVMMFEEVAPVGTVTDFHTHHGSDEVAYVLCGEITFKIGDEVTVGGPGTCAFMPRDVPHAWKSTGVEPGRVLFLYTPAAQVRRSRSCCTAPSAR
jgi:quercetin dioxygenase-like cupin family protein